MKKLTLLLAIFLCIQIRAQEVKINGNEFHVNGKQIWFNGINTPWHKFVDFGRQDFDYDWWSNEFARYPANKINLARVWIHMSGELSPAITDSGFVTGASELFWKHMDHLFKVSRENEVYLMPALFSFDITKAGYQTYEQWRLFIQSPEKIQSYIDNVLLPMLARYENEPYLVAWEICNEPEWMFENTEHGPQKWQDVQVFHAMLAAAIHKNSKKMVTTGSAAPKWNSPIYDHWGDAEGNMFSDSALAASIGDEDAFMDFYQYHWYPWQTQWMGSPFTNTTKYYEVDDRPVIVGESEGNDVCDQWFCQTVVDMYENAYLNGFDGVCAWKTPQNDGHGTFENIAVATNAFFDNHPHLVYPIFDPVLVTDVSVEPASKLLCMGEPFKLNVTIEPGNATNKNVIFTSDNDKVVTVDENGNIMTVGIGNAIITVETEDGGFTDECAIQVDDCVVPITSLELSPGAIEIPLGATEMLNLTILPANATNLELTWSSSDSGIAVISENGEVQAVGLGIAEVGVATADGKISDVSTVTVINPGSCDDPVLISMPFEKDGAGEFCWKVTGDIQYINSWNADLVEVNGVEITNNWTNSFPDKINGYYYIKFKAKVAWAHIEIEGESVGVEQYELITSVVGSGTITPAKGTFDKGQQVVLTATPSEGYVFESWGGDVIGNSNTLSLVMDSDKNIVATFIPVSTTQFVLTTTVEGNGAISVSPDQYLFDSGRVVTVTAEPFTGFKFTNWSGDVSGTQVSQKITMDMDKSIVAHFEEDINPPLCEDYTTISAPFSYDGKGDECWVTMDEISYINSWNLDKLTVNGVDFTNVYVSQLPAKINNSYYINYESSVNWGHIGIAGEKSKSIDIIDESFVFVNSNKEIVVKVSEKQIGSIFRLYDLNGAVLFEQTLQSAESLISVNQSINAGAYIVTIFNSQQICKHKVLIQ
ncbi:MAG: Ig-like domain-containing protein [Bacteroidales bacterium]|nr:Ig-like domain-containing protein [Bacteroidales bacterium]